MTVLLSALAFVLLLSVLILIHEWGHFYAARRAGVEVEEFGFGLPPRAKTLFRQGGTRFSLNWVPFGGFVRLKGENALEPEEHLAPGSFGGASIPQRVMILCGGVFMNFLLAFVILTLGFSIGQWIPTYTTLEDMEEAADRGAINMTLGVRIRDVLSGGGAAEAGVPTGAILTHVNGEPVTYPEEVVALHEGRSEVAYTIQTGTDGASEIREIVVSLNSEGQAGVDIAVEPLELSAPTRPIWTGVWLALRESWVMLVQTALGMVQLFTSLAQTGAVPEGITGIVGIAQLTHVSVQQGLMTYLRLVALLSLSLAALNILPFPALDGGRLLFVLAEGVVRRPLNRKFELVTNSLGFIFLLFLILLITYHDILRLF